MDYQDQYAVHRSKLERATQGRTLWQAFLKNQVKTLIHGSRRKQLGNKPTGGSKVDERNQADRRTDNDEFGAYDFWGAT